MMVLILILIPGNQSRFRDYPTILLSAVVYILSGQKSRYLVTLMPIMFSLWNIIIINTYLGVVTTDFIAKPEEERIEKVSDLVQEKGYRYVNVCLLPG